MTQGVERRPCRYCLELYRPSRSHQESCSAACRKAVARALADTDPLPASCRRTTTSEERRRATGYATVTGREAWEHDRRIRREAGLPVGCREDYVVTGRRRLAEAA